MFRALLCPSSEARYHNVDYHIGRFVLGLLYVGGWVRLGCSSVRAAARTLLIISNVCSCQQGNERSGYLKCGKSLHQLKECYFLKCKYPECFRTLSNLYCVNIYYNYYRHTQHILKPVA